MNVVFSPAWASFFASTGSPDSLLCFEGVCLLGWMWSILALTLASAWIVQRWRTGGEGDLAARLAPAATIVVPNGPPQEQQSRRTDLGGAAHALRAPPTTDMAADPVRNRTLPGRSSPSRDPHPRSTGTPTAPPSPGGLGQNSPV